MLRLVNAISLNMLGEDCTLKCERILLERAKEIWQNPAKIYGLDKEVVIGHQDLAAIVGPLMGSVFGASRATVQLNPEDECLVAQYTGPRLPEGTTKLPEGAKIIWWHVRVTASSV